MLHQATLVFRLLDHSEMFHSGSWTSRPAPVPQRAPPSAPNWRDGGACGRRPQSEGPAPSTTSEARANAPRRRRASSGGETHTHRLCAAQHLLLQAQPAPPTRLCAGLERVGGGGSQSTIPGPPLGSGSSSATTESRPTSWCRKGGSMGANQPAHKKHATTIVGNAFTRSPSGMCAAVSCGRRSRQRPALTQCNPQAPEKCPGTGWARPRCRLPPGAETLHIVTAMMPRPASRSVASQARPRAWACCQAAATTYKLSAQRNRLHLDN